MTSPPDDQQGSDVAAVRSYTLTKLLNLSRGGLLVCARELSWESRVIGKSSERGQKSPANSELNLNSSIFCGGLAWGRRENG